MENTKAFFSLCRFIGSKAPEWVQGAGGNVSQKFIRDGKKFMRIKASGYRLDRVNLGEGYVDLEYESTAAAVAKLKNERDRDSIYSNLLKDGVVFRAAEGNRASMETCFHLCIEAPLVAHFHSLAAVLLADGYFANDPKVLRFLKYESGLKISFVDFHKPGLDLAFDLATLEQSQIYILKNHGVILALENEKQISIWQKWEAKLIKVFGWKVGLQSQLNGATDYRPLKVYFPDTAVFLNEMMANLERDVKEPQAFRLKDSKHLDANTHELWDATQRLYNAKPSLQEVPESMWADIAGMPAEKFRIAMQAK